MNIFGRLLGFVLSLFGVARPGRRPAFLVRQDFVAGQLSAGTIYRLLHDRREGVAA